MTVIKVVTNVVSKYEDEITQLTRAVVTIIRNFMWRFR